MAAIINNLRFKAWDDDGNPLSGGTVDFYASGTNDRKDTYSDEARSATNANPVTLDAQGEADIYLEGSYKVVLKDADGVQQDEVDPLTDPATLQQAWTHTRPATQIDADTLEIAGDVTGTYTVGRRIRIEDSGKKYGEITGSSLVGGNTRVDVHLDAGVLSASVSQAAVYVVDFSFSKNLAMGLNVEWYGAKGDGSTDDSLALKKALEAANGRPLVMPPGEYICSSWTTPSISGSITIRGASKGEVVIHRTGGDSTFANATGDIDVSGVQFRDWSYAALPDGEVDHITYHSCKFDNCPFPLRWDGAGLKHKTLTITSCVFESPQMPIRVRPEVLTQGTIKDNLFTNISENYVINIGGKFDEAYQPDVGRLSITGNVIQDHLRSAGEIISIFINATYADISGNFIENVQANNGSDVAEGIYVRCRWARITNNSITDVVNSQDGYISYKGEQRTGSPANVQGWMPLIQGNVIRHTLAKDGRGISCQNEEVQILGNTFEMMTTNFDRAIRLYGGDAKCIIEGNYFYSYASNNIWLGTQGGSQVIIANNMAIIFNSSGKLCAGGDDLGGLASLSVVNNHVYDGRLLDVSSQGGSGLEELLIANNYVRNAGGAAFRRVLSSVVTWKAITGNLFACAELDVNSGSSLRLGDNTVYANNTFREVT